MSYEYKYTREIIDYNINGQTGKCWNIDKHNRVDAEGNQIFLANEIKEAIPKHSFELICASDEAKFVFETELTSTEQNTLTATVNNHKSNS